MQPGTAAFEVREAGNLPPGDEVGLLDGILGSLDIAQDPVRDGKQTAAVLVDERTKGVFIAPLRSLDQIDPHHATSGSHPWWALHPHRWCALGKGSFAARIRGPAD